MTILMTLQISTTHLTRYLNILRSKNDFGESCFGHLFRMDRGMKFSTGIVHQLLIRELHHNRPEYEMRFMLVRHSVMFLKVEFCLITRLKFGELPDTSTYDMVKNGIHQRYFEGRDEVKYVELKAVLRIGGAYMYRQSIYSFKHALDGRRRRFEQRQQRKGVDVHTTETYNIYGLTHVLLIFVFEDIPELGNSGCGKRREIELSPRILKWELSTQPRGEKLNSIFLESGGSLYDADVGDIPVPVSDLERYTTAGTSDTEGPSFEPSDTEGFDSDGLHIRPVRTRRVRFMLLREPRTRDDSRTGDDSRGSIGGQVEEEVRKSNEKRDQQHQELLDLIQGLQGSTSHTRT
ncbi:hypothetical protein LWI28_024939 [Acer negundo]|uniref:Uncharacterized protein n=1 Tax=Acer negundo TaxID=4023 RepID=A0AAD5J6S7_ACENE|nr:hypothetical protein LWI28_024939 [Acer negundo]